MQRLFEKQANIAKAIGHPVRVAVIDFLQNGEQCVCDIAIRVGSERTNLSKHLSVMVAAGGLQSRKDGLKVIYKIKTPCIVRFLDCLRECLKEQAKETQELLKAM